MKLSHKIAVFILTLLGIVLVFGNLEHELYECTKGTITVIAVMLKFIGLVCLFLSYRISKPHWKYLDDEDEEM